MGTLSRWLGRACSGSSAEVALELQRRHQDLRFATPLCGATAGPLLVARRFLP